MSCTTGGIINHSKGTYCFPLHSISNPLYYMAYTPRSTSEPLLLRKPQISLTLI